MKDRGSHSNKLDYMIKRMIRNLGDILSAENGMSMAKILKIDFYNQRGELK